MTRITKFLIDRVTANALLKADVTYDLAKLQDDRYTWAEAVRVEAFGGVEAFARAAETLKSIKTLRSELPEGIDQGYGVARKQTYLQLNLAGANITADFGRKRATPCRFTLLADNPLVQAFYDLEGREESLVAKGSAIEAQVKATLQQYTTVAKLMAAWPEVEELLPVQLKPAANLPVVQTKDLNALIGLPSA